MLANEVQDPLGYRLLKAKTKENNSRKPGSMAMEKKLGRISRNWHLGVKWASGAAGWAVETHGLKFKVHSLWSFLCF